MNSVDVTSIRETPPVSGVALSKWLVAINPALLVMGLLQGAYALALAQGIAPLDSVRVALSLAFFVAEAAAVRLINDYDDFKRGIDTKESVRPNSALALGLDMGKVRLVGLIALGAMVSDCIYLTVTVHPWLLPLLPIPFLAFILYSGGPRPLGHLALGELLDFWINGFGVVFAVVWANAGRVSVASTTACLGVGSLFATLMLHNNIRDVEKDKALSKRTIPQVIGKRNSRIAYTLLLSFSYVFVSIVALMDGRLVLLLPLATLPWSAILVWRVWHSELGESLFEWRDVYNLMIAYFALGAISWTI